MGASSSKAKPEEPLVFYAPSNSTISMTPELINGLQGRSPPPNSEKPKQRDNPLSGTVDPEQFDRLVNQRVQEEVDHLKKEESAILSNVQSHNFTHTQVLLEHLEDLNKKNKKVPVRELSSDLKNSKEALIACYKNNPKRTLDCWAEVESFREATLRAQQSYISSQL
ncbi:hypothetical protein DSO57_1025347 [Entomophthora muscae]|uniref:Uncharacterized protein n=2 Tax=Entomophthora muscae TaxID=34485 RepID=A0ACC2U0S6_9FUNG|nr:hypothetical protein DSO57_1025347 [Entomophthora muscae]